MNSQPFVTYLQIGFVVLALSTSSPALANRNWLCESDSWDTASCWSNNSPYPTPSISDVVYLTQTDDIDRTVTYRKLDNSYAYSSISGMRIDATGSGTMLLTQAQDSLVVRSIEYIGYAGNGNYSQSGGTHTADYMYLGFQATSHGMYNLTGGSLSANVQVIGFDGTGSFTQSGGLNTARNNLVLGSSSGSFGRYDLSGTGQLQAPSMRVGGSGTGVFNQTGGSVTISGRVDIASRSGSTSEYNISGDSTLSINNGLIIGTVGQGSFNQHSGTVTVGDYLLIDGNNSKYVLTGGSLAVSRIINGSGSNGQLHINGGTMTIGGGDGQIGVDRLYIGSATGTSGTHTLTGSGTINSFSTILGDTGHGEFLQNGGTHIANSLVIGDGVSGTGIYALSNGTLDAANIIVNPGGEFDFTGGTLIFDTFYGDLTNNGGTISFGGFPRTASIDGDYTQIAGIFDVGIGGNQPGTYDILNIAGAANLGGNLNLSFYDLGSKLFSPSAGDTFNILSAETIYGQFDLLTLAALGDGLRWDISYILDDIGTDYVRLSVAAVPVPPALWLLSSGLLGLIATARRKMN